MCRHLPALHARALGKRHRALKLRFYPAMFTRRMLLLSLLRHLVGTQDYIAAVYDLSVAYPDVPVFQTAADVVGAGTATARSQYYGSANNRSLWLGGMFDYRGLSDYTPMENQVR